MIPVAALRGDERLLDAWRRDGFDGAVHSVFDRVVNLAGERTTLASLSVRSLDDAPGTVRVDIDRFGPLALRPGMRTTMRGSMLRIDDADLTVSLEAATPWRPELPTYPEDDTSLQRNLAAVRDHLGAPPDPLLDAPSRAIAEALRAGDVARARAVARDLVGLGPGLTPSGDDFLVGLFAVLNVRRSPCHPLRHVCDAILADADTRTHAISLAALREAAQGRVRERVESLVRELTSGTPASTAKALDAVLAIGASSGRDLAAGILCGLEANTPPARAGCSHRPAEERATRTPARRTLASP